MFGEQLGQQPPAVKNHKVEKTKKKKKYKVKNLGNDTALYTSPTKPFSHQPHSLTKISVILIKRAFLDKTSICVLKTAFWFRRFKAASFEFGTTKVQFETKVTHTFSNIRLTTKNIRQKKWKTSSDPLILLCLSLIAVPGSRILKWV